MERNKTTTLLLIIAIILLGWWLFATLTNDNSPEPAPDMNGAQQPLDTDNDKGDDEPTAPTSTVYKDMIRVHTPLPEAEVSSPLTITGAARGPWYFEATFPIVLVDWDGRIIAESYAEAAGEWMTEDWVPFTAEIEFSAPAFNPRGALILQKANASGLPEHDDAFEFIIFFAETPAN